MLRVLAFLLALSTPALATECSTATEQQITEAIQAEPTRLIAHLEGAAVAHFVTNLQTNGYMVGTLPLIDSVYIVTAGKLPGYHTDNVWLFFIVDHCLIKSIPASKDVVMELLK